MLGLSRGVRRGALKYHAPAATGIHANSAAAGGGTGTSGSPFNTLAAAHTAVSPGGTIRLARGSVFRENLTITKANITVEPYGSGADPIISGGTLLTSWTFESTDVYYATGVTVEPMLVTFDGTRGVRRFYKTTMNSPGTIISSFTNVAEFYWDHRNSRLYVCSTSSPSSAWTTVEMAQRIGPVRVQATGVTLNTIKISHHNLDDRTNGVVTNSNNPTQTNITTQHSGDDVVDYFNIRSGRNDSPWNTRLTAATTTAAPQSGFTTLPFQFSEWQDMGVRCVQATGSDPLFSLYYSYECWNQFATSFAARYGNTLGVENTVMSTALAAFPNPRWIFQTTSTTSGVGTMPTDPLWNPIPNASPGPLQFRCPASLQPPPETDGYTAVFQPDGSVVELYAPIVLSQGGNANKIVAFGYSITNSYGKLDSYQSGITASMLPDYAGAAGSGSFNTVNRSVPHAIALYGVESYMSRAAVYPALTWDRTNAYSGTMPMGSRFCLPQSTNLSSNTWYSVAGYRFAQAALDYGFIWIDRGGGGGMTFKSRRGSTDTDTENYSLEVWTDMDWVRSRLVRVTG